jgi:hypothetical protein
MNRGTKFSDFSFFDSQADKKTKKWMLLRSKNIFQHVKRTFFFFKLNKFKSINSHQRTFLRIKMRAFYA